MSQIPKIRINAFSKSAFLSYNNNHSEKNQKLCTKVD